jgi:hypothetical protein
MSVTRLVWFAARAALSDGSSCPLPATCAAVLFLTRESLVDSNHLGVRGLSECRLRES